MNTYINQTNVNTETNQTNVNTDTNQITTQDNILDSIPPPLSCLYMEHSLPS